MSNTLSRKQIQQMRRLSNARFPMLGVVAVAALFVVRVPIIQSWESHADARNVQQLKKVNQAKTPDDLDTAAPQLVADATAAVEPEAPLTDSEDKSEPVFSTDKWFDLLTQFQPDEQNNGFPQNYATEDPSATDDLQDEEVDDLDLRHVSQLGPPASDPEPAETPTDDRVLRLHNPAVNHGIVYFVVDETTYSIDVGQTLELAGNDQWVVMFHRGGDFGNSRNVLKPGSYTFLVSKNGWHLEASN